MNEIKFGPVMRAITEQLKQEGKAINDAEIIERLKRWAQAHEDDNTDHGLSRSAFYNSIQVDEISTRWIKAFWDTYQVPPATWFGKYWYYGKNPPVAVSNANMAEALGYDPLHAQMANELARLRRENTRLRNDQEKK